jgi:aldose sugar dehydrogenase
MTAASWLAAILVWCAAASAACGKKGETSTPRDAPSGATPSGASNNGPGEPIETRPPNARHQKPAFAGQTRAPRQTLNVAFDVQRVAGDLDHPWAVAFLPSGRMLVTERSGRMRLVSKDGSKSDALGGVPKVDARGQGGLLDVVLDPQHATNKLVYWSYAEPRDGGNGTAVARGKLNEGGAPPRLEQVQVIWRMQPTLDSKMHFGCRLVFADSGELFIATGERSIAEGRAQAQRLDSAFGKIIRIRSDGSVPGDNPFVGKSGALPEIYSLGHRNTQSATLHPVTRKLWIVEHGAKGGDELNVVEPGKNYGWPTIAYGLEYSGAGIGEGLTAAPNLQQPIYYWDPVIAPSGMAFYTGELFPAWKGSLFVGGLAAKHVARLSLDGTRVVGEERLLEDRARFRDVRVGPEGALYLLTDEDDGELLRLVPSRG